MIFLNDGNIRELGIDWLKLTNRIESTLRIMDSTEVVQPLKPYLRFRSPANRIIAMPAFVGGDTDICGIKWIASFPGNVNRGIPRAHSTIILNNPANGAPIAIINSSLLSELRTAAVSSVMLRHYMELERRPSYRVGTIGWGPIGRRHMDMLFALYGERVHSVRLYDIKGIESAELEDPLKKKAVIKTNWLDVYRESDIVFTCTTTAARYINEPPLPGSLLMNISLREYMYESMSGMKAIVVDNWQEVCRENTDIEMLHKQAGLNEGDTISLSAVLLSGALRSLAPSEPVFFNPMGMAAFDITLAASYWREAERLGVGVRLAD